MPTNTNLMAGWSLIIKFITENASNPQTIA